VLLSMPTNLARVFLGLATIQIASSYPTIQKKIRVLADWTLDIFFKRDVTMLRPLAEQKSVRRG
jgi:hypothetical protein